MFAENISIRLASKYDVTVICSKYYYSENELNTSWKGVNRHFINLKANGIQSLAYDLLSLSIAAKTADHIILLGIGAGLFFPLIKSEKLIIHIDGLEWKRAKWNMFARFILRQGFIHCLKYAHAIIIDNPALLEHIPGKFLNKIRYIAYGGDHVQVVGGNNPKLDKPYALVIARAEPENKLHVIIEAFSALPSQTLIIISNWNNTRYGKHLFKQCLRFHNISCMDPIYDITELQRYRKNCAVYIHGHSAGGTNPSLVEAMYSQIPIIAWDNKFNRNTTNELAEYFSSVNQLIDRMNSFKQDVYAQQAVKMFAYALENYTWSDTVKRLIGILEE
jgi:glycosyltransferase involved in cell wall biosynthesis